MFLCITLLISVAAIAQRRPAAATKKSVVHLIKSQSAQGIKLNGTDIIKVYKGTFLQDYSKLSSDSAYFNQALNSFDAFGHVWINQGDTLNIYADKLNYNGNTHTAILTDHVRMVDKDATLTTDYFTYNTATRVGTYTGGGKLVNKQNTLTSKNGYYYAFTRDSYFRYNAVLVTNDAVIKTDTLRYNTGSRIAYFYGPTHIYGNKNKDTLYTENGTYNTVVEQAFFGKKNLYSQGTKTLKGDSLFYDRLKGYGRAINHVTFNDREQKITMKGDLGTYFNADERTVVTKNAYVILVTEQQDSTKTDSANTKLVKADSAKTIKATQTTVKIDSAKAAKDIKQLAGKTPAAVKDATNVVKPAIAGAQATSSTTDKIKTKAAIRGAQPAADTLASKSKSRTKLDSVYIAADTLDTQILTFKKLRILQENMRPNKLRDSLAKIAKERRAPLYTQSTSKHLYQPPMLGVPQDTSLIINRLFFGMAKAKPTDTTKKKPAGGKKPAVAKIRPPAGPDSVYMSMGYKANLSDTSRIRILTAHHHALLYKSDLQAKADSMFYSYSDSTLRCFVRPILWTQGSQLTSDTLYLQMKNKKLNNMDLFPNAFIVNIEGADSTHFNQVSGKKMRGFFVNNKMSQMYVDGNAETIYFARDSGKVTEMDRNLTSRIKVNFKDNKVTTVTWYVKPEGRYGPLTQFKEDERTLKGFIWKPKERPVSKEYVITAYSRRLAEERAAVRKQAKTLPGKKPAATGAKASGATATPGSDVKVPDAKTKAAADSTARPVPPPVTPAAKDSAAHKQPVKAPASVK